ncbi:hypothetical protein DRW03_27325 [Corallococcus sp. H22C18031201]|nr:hypothetical protein DRW03_27325 [Corallococcus sp. H22C18031201]
MRRLSHLTRLLAALGLSGCAASRPPPPLECPTRKFAFTREQSCRNDGWVEFCLPSDDTEALARVRAIVPDARTLPSGGRARCDVPAQVLVQLPTPTSECTERHGALQEPAWERLCRVAALPEVQRVVPTWFE